MKVALYIRVSTERQANEGDSLEEQENELKKYCDFRKFAIHQTYIERGKSGGNTNRPEYQKLIKDIQKKRINAVVVKKLDRLSRSLLDFENLMRMMNENDVEFISIKENFDTTTAMGKAMLRVALVFAQLEREQTSERLSDVMNFRATQGLFNGGFRPYGYSIVEKELVPYPKEKEQVEFIFDKFLDNRSTTLTAKALNNIGYRNRKGDLWDKRQIQRVLQNPVYIGQIRWNRQCYAGVHQPLVSEKHFKTAQLLFKQTHIAIDSVTKALAQRLLRCGDCGSPMTPSHSINRHKIKYFYYRCTSTQSSEKGTSTCSVKYINQKRMDYALIQGLLSLTQAQGLTPVENQILKHNLAIEKDVQSIQEDLRLQEAHLQQLETRKDKFFDSLISGQFNAKERDQIQQQIDAMQLKEKQQKAHIAKLTFDLTQKQEEAIDISRFKEMLIHYKADHEQFSLKEHKAYLFQHLTQIVCHKTHLDLQFKVLPWIISLPLEAP
jgi:site-specific DNA recombinase